ncbi:MAG: type I 3-dehydroquinate dehydratase [Candidatus Odinarchaeota archaeon]
MKYNICIPIPIKSNNLRGINLVIDRALEFNPEFIELRFDYIDTFQNITQDFVQSLKNYIKNKSSLILTFRHHSEGGQTKIDEFERLKILKILMNSQPEFFDIEMNSATETLSTIISLSFMKKVNLIFSYHNFEETIPNKIAKEIILRFEERIIKNELNEFDILGKSIYKLIFTAQNFEDNLVALELCKEISKNNKKVISFCMGELGILSRILSVKLGSFLTYAALEEPTAPGQIKINTLQKIYKLLFSD